MSETLGYVLTGAVVILAVVIIVMLTKLSSMGREIRDTRKETAQTLRSSYADTCQALTDNAKALNQALSDEALATEQKLEYLRYTMENRLEAIRTDNNQQLEKMRVTVDEKLQKTLDERISHSFDAVRQSLDAVYKGLGEMQTLAAGVGDLKKVLTNVKSRGILGEIQLGSILEQILSPQQYEENVSTVPGSTERVEYAVKMPGDGDIPVLLPIDAKFPGDSYANLMEAYDRADAAEIANCRKILRQQLKKEAKDIQTKYVRMPYTTEFAVMFLPFEGLYAEAVNMGVMEEIQRQERVMLAGPSTMAALLNSLQMGFRTLAIQQNAGEVWKILGSVKTEFDNFEDVLTKTQSRLTQAGEELDKLVGVRTRAIRRTLKDVQTLQDPDRPSFPFSD